MTDLRQDKNYAKYMELIGWKSVSLKNSYVYLRKIPLIGFIAKLQRPEKKLSLKEIKNLTSTVRVFAYYIEPKDEMQERYYQNYGFKLCNSASLASKTVRIELDPDPERLLEKMHYKTRYNIKLSERLGVRVKKGKYIEKFAKFWQESARKRGMFFSMKNEIKAIYTAFGKSSVIYNAYWQGKKVAAVLTVASGKRIYYMYAASNKVGKKVNAPTKIVWEILLDSKKRGLKEFDFEGIYDERFPIKTWKGFSRFKKSFGGKEVEFPGMYKKLSIFGKIY